MRGRRLRRSRADSAENPGCACPPPVCPACAPSAVGSVSPARALRRIGPNAPAADSRARRAIVSTQRTTALGGRRIGQSGARPPLDRSERAIEPFLFF
eukprot:4364143-Pyramimonas_sp.AAC.1